MPKQDGQKPKQLTLLRILYEQTDEDHRLGVPALMDLLAAQGIPCERKSVYSDIATLQQLGYNIELQRGRGGGYWMASREFELPELKLLVDAVQASRFIPKEQCSRLIKKLEKLASRYQAGQLQRQVYVDGRPRSGNKQLLYSVDALHQAISAGREVRFFYRKPGEEVARTVSPWQLAWDNGYYYLIAWQASKGLRHYRVDRMRRVEVLGSPRQGKAEFRQFDLPAYLRQHFSMFGGEVHRVTLRCEAHLADTMRDRFGRDVMLLDEEDGHFHFDADVAVSPPFFGWVMGFGGQVEVLAPAAVRAQMREQAIACAALHED